MVGGGWRETNGRHFVVGTELDGTAQLEQGNVVGGVGGRNVEL